MRQVDSCYHYKQSFILPACLLFFPQDKKKTACHITKKTKSTGDAGDAGDSSINVSKPFNQF